MKWAAVLVGLSLFGYMITPVTATHLPLGSLPVQAAVVLVAFGVTLLAVPSALSWRCGFSVFEWAMIAVMFLSVVSHEALAGDREYIRTGQLVVGICLAVVAAAMARDTTLWAVCAAFMTAGAMLSASVVIIQYFFSPPWAWAYTVYDASVQKIPSGLEMNPVAFAYSILGVLVYRVGLVLRTLGAEERVTRAPGRVYHLMIASFMIAALILTESMSGMLGLVTAVLVLLKILRPKRRAGVQIGAALIIAFGIGVFSLNRDHMVTSTENISADARLGSNFSRFLPALFASPLGVYDYAAVLDGSGLRSTAEELLVALRANRGEAPHNVLLTTALIFGVPASAAQALLMISVIVRGTTRLRAQPRPSSDRAFVLSCTIAALAGLTVHMWFHNASFVLGEMRNWFWLASCASLATAFSRQDAAGAPKLRRH